MATILLVSIAVVAFVFVFVWSRGFIHEGLLKFEEPIEDSCSKLSFDASLSESGREIYVNNMGDIPIYGLNIRIISGESDITKFVRPEDGNIYAGESDSLLLDSVISSDAQVIIAPGLLGEGEKSKEFKIYICENEIVELQ